VYLFKRRHLLNTCEDLPSPRRKLLLLLLLLLLILLLLYFLWLICLKFQFLCLHNADDVTINEWSWPQYRSILYIHFRRSYSYLGSHVLLRNMELCSSRVPSMMYCCGSPETYVYSVHTFNSI
jgi:hypothetical protein